MNFSNYIIIFTLSSFITWNCERQSYFEIRTTCAIPSNGSIHLWCMLFIYSLLKCPFLTLSLVVFMYRQCSKPSVVITGWDGRSNSQATISLSLLLCLDGFVDRYSTKYSACTISSSYWGSQQLPRYTAYAPLPTGGMYSCCGWETHYMGNLNTKAATSVSHYF